MQNSGEKISVIIPIYNVEKYLKKCLDSIINQTYRNLEIILVDDGSPDNCGKICDIYAERDKRIKVIHKQNAGVAAARNSGIDIATGKWVAFIDSDDWLDENMFQIAYKEAELYKADIVFFDGIQEFSDKIKHWNHFEEDFFSEDINVIRHLSKAMLYFPMSPYNTKVPLAAPWDKLYNLEFLRKNSIRYTENLKTLDDMVFNMQAFFYARRVRYIRKALYHYRIISTSITNSYKPNRVELDKITFKRIEEIIKQTGFDEAIQAYYARIIKSFSICCRLSFFNKQNQKRHKEKLAYVKEVLGEEPYNKAFRNIDMKHLEGRLKFVVLCARYKWINGIYLLFIGNTLIERMLKIHKG